MLINFSDVTPLFGQLIVFRIHSIFFWSCLFEVNHLTIYSLKTCYLYFGTGVYRTPARRILHNLIYIFGIYQLYQITVFVLPIFFNVQISTGNEWTISACDQSWSTDDGDYNARGNSLVIKSCT